jgi:hypothetical protein
MYEMYKLTALPVCNLNLKCLNFHCLISISVDLELYHIKLITDFGFLPIFYILRYKLYCAVHFRMFYAFLPS